MNSAHALELTRQVIQNDLEAAGPLLKLLSAFDDSQKPSSEAMRRDVMFFLYSKTEHCEAAMKDFISQNSDQTPLAA